MLFEYHVFIYVEEIHTLRLLYESSSLKNETCPGFSLHQMKGLTRPTFSIDIKP